ncbi:TssN family type VI secretion system protein [Chitinophaga sp. sic0106]|uniref:TssN family type VI secretion system protein n=1 Tax=Chitinophaga sp. sic0106 TaxID=2854785 RepID=UPI001C4632B0|nr:TssN family type VI secretion system protein [Chitinophaga sp. sic0106]MBV7532254.1 TssN family type VI secretion system protein [Chitinophaga sp. sic0106]
MKNLLLLTLLVAATIGLAIVSRYCWIASAKAKPVILILLLSGLGVGTITTMLVPKLLATPWLIFLVAEAVAISVGAYIALLISFLRVNKYRRMRLEFLIGLCYVLLVSTLAYAACYWAFISSLATILLWRVQVMVLLILVMIEMGKAFYNLPTPAYAPWIYPVPTMVDDIAEEDMNELLVVGLRISKMKDRHTFTYFRARAPLHISWGDFFYHFLNDYNEKHPEQKIELLNAGGDAYHWQFFRLRKYWPAAIIDYNRPVQFTGIKENSVIVCLRV